MLINCNILYLYAFETIYYRRGARMNLLIGNISLLRDGRNSK